MTASRSRLLMGTIASKLTQSEVAGAVYLCHDIVPDSAEVGQIKTAYDLMEFLGRHKVIDPSMNDWQQLIKLMESTVVRRKDLARHIIDYRNKEEARLKEEIRLKQSQAVNSGFAAVSGRLGFWLAPSEGDVGLQQNKEKSSTKTKKPTSKKITRTDGVRRKDSSAKTASTSSIDLSIVQHPDWNFHLRLAEGESSIVYRGTKVQRDNRESSDSLRSLPPQDVVGKAYRSDGRIADSKLFLRQAEALKDLGEHNSVVRLIEVLRDDVFVPCLVLELAPYGDLQTFLAGETGRQTTVYQLVKFARQVADGMSYLESKKYIHANLRASSVLLFKDDVVKISGFSLCRRSNDENPCCKVYEGEMLALKWHAPEVLREHVLRPQSDVWSFGVFVVEIFQYGAEPYAGLSMEELQVKLDKGYRHPKPSVCPEQLYNDILLEACWQKRSDRPNFELLRLALSTILCKRRDNSTLTSRKFHGDGYLSVISSTIRTSVDNQYIDCAGLQSVWKDFDSWEVEPKSLRLQALIGFGHFGMVWKGELESGELVAVKTCTSDSDLTIDSFFKEARVMTTLEHDHIVRLYGICTTKPGADLYIITELMSRGDLRHLLLDDAGQTIQIPNLINYAIQIADALGYIESRNAIHCDVAARNVLVSSDMSCVKLGDFGLAQFLKSDYYRLDDVAQIPVRWTAPEVISLRKYSIKSDCWAFGIYMVELFLYGDQPYSDMDAYQLYLELKSGFRHPRPDNCPESVYDVMLTCWNEDPQQRPPFHQIQSDLSGLGLQDLCGQESVSHL